ncbi:MAG: hypothetical protein WCL61_03270 [bacterium]
MKNKKIITHILISLSLFSLFFLIAPFCGAAGATDKTIANLDIAGNGLAKADLVTVIGKLVSFVLGFLSIILILLILWAGWNWMTAMDDEDKIKKAKATISAAVIGIVIIMSSYIIATFVINNIKANLGQNTGKEATGQTP